MNVVHIALRELRSTFSSAIGWIVLFGWLVVTGYNWLLAIGDYVRASQGMAFDPYSAGQLNFSEHLLQRYFWTCTIILTMLAPALSMRLFSEELKQRTLELLLSSPVSTLEIVLGKYLGGLVLLGVMLAGTLHGPLGLFLFGDVDPGPLVGCYLALGLLGAALLAMGMFASALTANQAAAMVMTLAAALVLLFLGFASLTPGDWFEQVSTVGHVTDLMRGAIKLSDIVYYVVFIAFFVFATHQRMESYRWK